MNCTNKYVFTLHFNLNKLKRVHCCNEKKILKIYWQPTNNGFLMNVSHWMANKSILKKIVKFLLKNNEILHFKIFLPIDEATENENGRRTWFQGATTIEKLPIIKLTDFFCSNNHNWSNVFCFIWNWITHIYLEPSNCASFGFTFHVYPVAGHYRYYQFTWKYKSIEASIEHRTENE